MGELEWTCMGLSIKDNTMLFYMSMCPSKWDESCSPQYHVYSTETEGALLSVYTIYGMG